MRRRDFIKAVARSAAVWPLAARAQQVAMPVIGWLGTESPGSFENAMRAFRQGLSQSGYLEVGFEVPSGGAFRVIDVIVTEAPRFNP